VPNWLASPGGCSSLSNHAYKPETRGNRQPSLGGQGHTARRFLFRNLETKHKQHESPGGFEYPPGDFWKISRNPEFRCDRK